MANAVIVLTNQNELTYTSNAVKGDGYYGFADGLQTMSFHLSNFTGRIHLEATLILEPSETDWFEIELDQEHPYLEFTASSTTVGTTFQGNFVWIRAKVDRDYLGDAEYDSTIHGLFDKAIILI